MKLKSIIPTGVSILVLLVILAGCEKMEDTYSEFVEGGETVYIAKADSIKVRPGHNRIEISWLLLSDPKVDSYKVYWNNRRDSIENTVVKTAEIDTVRLLLSDMPEDVYNFEIIMYDNDGHSSVVSSTTGRVYGENYQNSLFPRPYNSMDRKGEDLVVDWAEPQNTVLFDEVEYLDRSNKLVTQYVSKEAEVDTLPNFPIDGSFKYRTAFLPDSTAIDTFYTSYQNVVYEEKPEEFDKELWIDANLADDNNLPRYGPLSELWTPGGRTYFFMDPDTPSLKLPNWFTIDLGKKYIFERMKLELVSHSNGWMYSGGAPLNFEIWASNEATTDWSKWDKLGEFEVTKPSGLPLGEVSAEDAAFALAGEDFEFEPNPEAYRYVRFVTTKTFGGQADIMLLELSFWGKAVD